MPGTYPDYLPNTQDTKCDIPGRTDIANASDYNDHDREILSHQTIIKNHEGRIVVLEAGTSLSSLNDVEIAALASGNIIQWDGTKWVNTMASFDTIDVRTSQISTDASGALVFTDLISGTQHLYDLVGGGTGGGNGVVGADGASGYSGYSGVSGYSGYSGSGTSGYSGYSGRSGYSGYSGASGYSGYSGSGLSGYSGYSGKSGYSGYSGSGISGYSGYSGAGTSGYSGYSGAGLSGYSGYSGSGISGYSGYSGAGTSGYSGYSGAGTSGYSGYSGISGYSGYSGTSGYSGYSGKSGYSGYSGSGLSGYSGYSGSGLSGYSGYSGAGTSGYSGYSGISGYSGYSGSGLSGYSGYSGISGYSGYSGISGYSGYSGKSGYSGYSGSGLSGYSGYSGTGQSGYSGYSGAPGTGLTAKGVYSAGTDYEVNDLVTYGGNAWLSLLHPNQGNTPVEGAYWTLFSSQGTSGYSGSGISGYSGYSGISGYSGYSGVSGYSGYSGPSGYSGYSGKSGYSGYSGSGISGYSGYSGSGLSGYSGYSGSGSSGYSGYSGSGMSGYSGYSGKSGYSGYSGSGISGYSGYSGSGTSGYSGYSGSVTSGMFVPLGTPTDGALTDGIHAWTISTLVTDALDDCNETLSYLAPADAGALTGALTMAGTTKYTGYLSAGNTNYKTGEGAGTSVAYIISDPTFTLASPSASTAFNKSDEGYTKWYSAVGTAAYGAAADSVDHGASFNAANRGSTQTNVPWTTGQLSVTSVGWYNSFPKWQKGNATLTITASQLSQGYNKIKMTREGSFTTQLTSDYEVFYDNDAGASPSVGTVTVAEGTPATRKLSGVVYYDRGSTFTVSVVGSHCFDNVYAQYPLVITSSASNCMGNVSVAPADATVSGVSTPPAINETMTVTNKVITVPSSNVRSLNAQVTVTPTDPYGTYTAGTSASAGRLVDGYINTATGTATDIAEYFDNEWYRLLSNFDITSTTYSSGATGGWNSTTSLVSGTAGYDGLQVINGAIQYPVTNYTSGYLPSAGQVDYSGATGSRVYIRYFYVGTGKQNFTWTVTGTTMTFVSVATGPSSNNVTFEMLAPATTKNSGGTVEWKDCYVPYTDDASIGCYASGTRSASTTNWVTTLGTKSTATSGLVVCVRITAAAGWSGNLATLSVGAS